MGLRGIVLVIAFAGCVPLALYDSFLGLLAYCWVSFMKPQSLAWSPAIQSMRIAFVLGLILIVRSLFSPGPRVRFRGPTLAFLAVWAWFGVCVVTSTDRQASWVTYEQFCKIAVAALLITGLVRSRKHMKWLMIVLAACPGFWGAKGGLFFARAGGAFSTASPLIGMDNNDLALFMSLAVPLLVFTAQTVKSKRWRYVMYAAAALCVPGVILTGSRGGMLAVAAGTGLTVWRKTNWRKATLAGAVLLGLGLAILPGRQQQRYDTIDTYQQDPSAMGRIRAWRVAMAMAADRPVTGIGLGDAPFMKLYPRYQTDPDDYPHVEHSVWFSLIAETGYVGLALYLTMLASVLVVTRRVMKAGLSTAGRTHWTYSYAAGLQTALLAFIVGGTFLSRARFEFVFALCMASVPLAVLTERRLSALARAKVKARAKARRKAKPTPQREALA